MIQTSMREANPREAVVALRWYVIPEKPVNQLVSHFERRAEDNVPVSVAPEMQEDRKLNHLMRYTDKVNQLIRLADKSVQELGEKE